MMQAYGLTEAAGRRIAAAVRRIEAAAFGPAAGGLSAGGGHRLRPLRHRVPMTYYAIVSDDGDGAYTVRQQEFNAEAAALQDLSDSSHEYYQTDLSAMEVRGAPGCSVGAKVPGWWLDWDGEPVLVIEAPAAGADGGIAWVAQHLLHFPAAATAEGTQVIGADDWRGRIVWGSMSFTVQNTGSGLPDPTQEWSAAYALTVLPTFIPEAIASDVLLFIGYSYYPVYLRLLIRATDGALAWNWDAGGARSFQAWALINMFAGQGVDVAEADYDVPAAP